MKLKEITCLSDLYYVIGRWFTLGMIAVAFVVLPFALMVWESVFSFLMCGGIAFVGVAANYRDKYEYKIHYLSAMVSAACSIVWLSFVSPMSLLMLVPFLGMAYYDKYRRLLWCEVACFFSVFVTIAFRM